MFIHIFIYFLLFILPLIVWPFSNSQFESPKVLVAMITIDLLAVSYFLKYGTREFGLVKKPVVYALCVLLLLSMVHLLFRSTSVHFLGNDFRMQGILLFWHLLVLLFLSAQIPQLHRPYYWYGIPLLGLFLSSLIFGNSYDRSVGTLGEPNALAATAAFFWPFLLLHPNLPKKYRYVITGITAIAILLLILLSGSRSGLIAVILQLTFYLLIRIKTNLKVSIGIILALFLLVQTLPLFSQSKYEDRFTIWQTAVVAGAMHPLLGGGFGNTEVLLRTVVEREQNMLIGYYVDSSHNLFLDWWVQGGSVGLATLLFLLGGSIKHFYERKAVTELVVLFGILTALTFNPASVVSLIHLWWLVGQGYTSDNDL